MLTKEDLQAIGSLMDTKLEPIRGDISELKQGQEETNKRIDNLEGKIDNTNKRIDNLGGKIDDTNKRIDNLEGKIDDTNKQIDETNSSLKSEINKTNSNLKSEINKVYTLIESDVMRKISLLAENHSALVAKNDYIIKHLNSVDDVKHRVFALEIWVAEHMKTHMV